MSEMGHNSIAGDRLLSIVERIERLNEEVKALNDDKKDIMTEAKSAGFDPKTIRAVIKMRAEDEAEREERQMLLDLYLKALGLY